MKEGQLLKSFFKTLTLLLVLYATTRGLFLWMNIGLFQEVEWTSLFKSFAYGIRFDLSAIFMVNGLLFLTFILLGEGTRRFGLLLKLYFVILNGAFLGLNIMDAEFYKFNGKRFTADYLKNAEDIQRHSLSVFISYWWLFGLFLASLALLYFAYPRLFKASSFSPLKRALYGVSVIGLTVVGVRGGLQLKPISLITAYSQSHQALGALVLNTPFTFVRGHQTGLNEAPVFIEDLREARRMIQNFRESSSSFVPLSKEVKNIVILVVESLSLEYTGLIEGQESYTPFLDELAKSSLAFVNHYANGRRSIEAMPSLFCGLPSLVSAPIITSSLGQNELFCLPEFFAREGFETAFFHGAHNGSFHMDSFSNKAGFKHFYGFNEYPNPQDSDGSWGILDEPMLRFMANEISRFKRPFFAGAFTLSSHHPYFIPEHLRPLFKDGTLEIHKSIGYADYALKAFFEEARKHSWFSETWFFITADHTQKSADKRYQFLSGEYRVPLLIYSESAEFRDRFLPYKKEYENKVTQGVDLLPTVLEAMGVKAFVPLPPFGGNILDKEMKGFAVNFDGFQYWMRSDSKVFAMDREGRETEFVVLDENGFLEQRPKDFSAIGQEKLVLKALISFFNKSMRQNSVYKTDP